MHGLNIFTLSLGPYQKPVYTGINSSSIYTSHAVENNQHVFTVEPGNRFYLKLNLTANPWPTNDDLSKNGSALQRVQWAGPGTISLGVDSINIQSTQYSDAGNYVISCSNFMGKGRFPFRLKVESKV